MADETGRLKCQAGCWITGSIIGLVGIFISILFGDLSVTGAIFVGALIAVALSVLLSVLLCKPLPPPMAAGSAPTVGSTKAAAPAARSAAPAAATKPAASPEPVAATERPAPSAAAGVAATGAATPAAAPTGGESPPAAATAETPGPAPAPAEPTDADRPATLDAPREGGADDLKQIKGVGPKLEKLLHSMGFFHFDQIANWSDREIAWVDANLEGFKGRVTRDDWVAQARTLADGGSTAFSSKVKGGNVY